MRRAHGYLFCLLAVLLPGCMAANDGGTIAQLRTMRVEIKEEIPEGGLEKAIASYQSFLQEAPESALTPEAIRRLADLKVEKEYGYRASGNPPAAGTAASLTAPERVTPPPAAAVPTAADAPAPAAAAGESSAEFERRATQSPPVASTVTPAQLPEGGDDLERAGALEAVALYQKLLEKYPLYDRNDQVLYQMSRAYEELGRIEDAMDVMGRLVRDFPRSSYLDEVQFRRAEYFFTRHRYLDAEDAYGAIVQQGVGSSFYELALYKLGWTFYKQELYEETLHKLVALLDHKVAIGYDFAQSDDDIERKRVEDCFRVVSLSFSNLGGADSAVDYFSRHGQRSYEDSVYSNLGEYYFDKRRYNDAAATYNAFISRNAYHRKAPNFLMRVIEIHKAGGFPSLILETKKEFAIRYGLKADYWEHFQPSDRPDVLGFLKTNLTDLANYYHALYQNPRHAKDKGANFDQALHWYREFLVSFPAEVESPVIHYQMADLLLENTSFGEAAAEYEKIAYNYPAHEKSAAAGYAAVYAYRQQLGVTAEARKDAVKREVVRSSLTFADRFPGHEKAALVLAAAADDLYSLKDYEQAVAAGRKLIEVFPGAEADIVRSAWLVVGHSSYELARYGDAEAAYVQVLALLPAEDKARAGLVDNLAASIYKQGEQARNQEDYRSAANHFLRVGQMAPTSTIRATADYDAAGALILLKDWEQASVVLVAFRGRFPGHELQPEVTKRLASVYREAGQLAQAASEYERIETETKDEEIRREALLTAAELYEQAGDNRHALKVYRRFLGTFPRPVEPNLEARNKVAEILKAEGDRNAYLDELRSIVAIEAKAGAERTPRTRYLAAHAALILAEPAYEAFAAVKLVKPFDVNLRKKKNLMKVALQDFNRLLDYEVGEVTAAATFYLAEIYAHFSKALMASERPEGLSPLEMEQYELAIEEQAYPFEERAIMVHESNLKLIEVGVYNAWVDKSLKKLAVFMPARYDKPEKTTGIVRSLEMFTYEISRPAPAAQVTQEPAAAAPAQPEQAQEPAAVTPAQPEQAQEPAAAAPAQPEQAQEPAAVTPAQPEQAQEPAAVTPAQPEQAQEPAAAAPAQPEQVQEPAAVAPETMEQAEEPEATTPAVAVAPKAEE